MKRSPDSVIAIWEDLGSERGGFRAFWTDSPNGHIGCPVIGYGSGGNHKTVKAAAMEARLIYPDEAIYRNGRPVKLIVALNPLPAKAGCTNDTL